MAYLHENCSIGEKAQHDCKELRCVGSLTFLVKKALKARKKSELDEDDEYILRYLKDTVLTAYTVGFCEGQKYPGEHPLFLHKKIEA